MKVTATPSPILDVTISASVAELRTLFNATRKGRRTKEELAALEYFGDLIAMSHPDFVKGVIGGQKEVARLRKKREKPQAPLDLTSVPQPPVVPESTYRESTSAIG